MKGTVETVDMPLKDIHVDPKFNSRENLEGDTTIAKFAAGMKKDGQLHPIVVRPRTDKKGGFDLIIGFRRYAAAVELGWTSIRAQVAEMAEEKARVINFRENLDREDLSTFDIANGVVNLQKDFKWEFDKIAKELGLHRKYVENLARARTKLHDRILKAWRSSDDPAHGVCTSDALIAWAAMEKDEQLSNFQAALGEKDTSPDTLPGQKEKKPKARRYATIIDAVVKSEKYEKTSKGGDPGQHQYALGVMAALRWVVNKETSIPGVVIDDAVMGGFRPTKDGSLSAKIPADIMAQGKHAIMAYLDKQLDGEAA